MRNPAPTRPTVTEDGLRKLFESLDRRLRPEEVATLVEQELDLSRDETYVMKKVTGHKYYSYSSMSGDFKRPVGMEQQVKLISLLLDLNAPDKYDLVGIDAFILESERRIIVQPGSTDFKHHRLNREARKLNGLGISRRQYNKLFRLAGRMEEKRKKFGIELEKREFQQVSKSRLASKIKWEDMQDPNTAAFVAYFTSKCNLRSTFTNTAQDRPFDDVCAMLLQRCEQHPDTTNWWTIAHVYPDAKVLDHLSDEQKGILLARWYDVLNRLANLLKETWEKSDINRQTMIVKKGNDSSTWNTMAGAWNKARDGWISLLHALKMEGLLDEMCIGKVLRLMAGDVAYWHRATGSKLEPDTAVWAKVPLPWEVLSGEIPCTRLFVEKICGQYGVDAVKKGWTSAKKGGEIHEFKPTPELVHGVTVSHPHFAKVLRKIGVFSGKTIHWG